MNEVITMMIPNDHPRKNNRLENNQVERTSRVNRGSVPERREFLRWRTFECGRLIGEDLSNQLLPRCKIRNSLAKPPI